MSLRLSPEEAWAFLEKGHTGILTSLRRDGWPISLPVWYVAMDRRIYVSGPARTKKYGRMKRDPRVAFLVETGLKWKELSAVHLTGRARFVIDANELARVQAAMDAKYAAFRTDRSKMPAATSQHYSQQGSATVCIEPEGKLLTWDNARLGVKD
ncbi:MAG TPA: pyridoxamine 5'-phosphate oxidase family protein [Myxococcota bacterium]|nr:pyridoxamine 5'-phosphate oxidase family protein [Myxococcota bacterium]